VVKIKRKKIIKEFVHFVPNLIYESQIANKLNATILPLVFTNEDHFPHSNANIEWWYFTGVLETPLRKNKIGFEVTFFRFQTIFEGRIIHTAITDIENKTFYNKELILPIASESLFQKGNKGIISIFKNRVEFHDQLNSFKIKTEFKDLKIDLNLTINNLMHGGKDGILKMQNYQDDLSYYFSFPDLKTEGKVIFKDETLNVSGLTWHDHQWGNFHIKNLKWDWFSLRFDEDDIYIMIFNFRRKGREITTGNFYKNPKNIQLENIRITAKKTFKTKDGVEYPLNWEIEIPGGKNINLSMKFNVFPLIDGQHISSFITHSYWEGICQVEGKITENYEQEDKVLFEKKSLKGTAYVELTGYE